MKNISFWIFLGFMTGLSYFINSDSAESGQSIDRNGDWKNKTDSEWKKILTQEQFKVCRKGGTEFPYSGKYNKHYNKGKYYCSSCGLLLFDHKTKFDSGTGWPSFYESEKNGVETKTDSSLGMTRTEVVCKRCGAHLGHVFEDGPKPTGKRYCINSVCLNFKAE